MFRVGLGWYKIMAETVETNFDEFKEIAHSWQIGQKPKAYTSFVPYLKVFKNDLYYFIFELLNSYIKLYLQHKQ